MNDIDKRLEEIEEYVKFRCGSHPDNVRWLISTLRAEREAVKRSHKQLNQKSEQIDHVLEQLQAEREEKERLERSIESALRDFDREDRLEGLITLKEALGGDRE